MFKYTDIMKFTQHVPGAVDLGDEAPYSFEFETVEELVSNEFVQRFSKSYAGSVFHQFSISPMHPSYSNYRFDTTLMAEYNDGTKWWCVGHIDQGKNLALPNWEPVHNYEK